MYNFFLILQTPRVRVWLGGAVSAERSRQSGLGRAVSAERYRHGRIGTDSDSAELGGTGTRNGIGGTESAGQTRRGRIAMFLRINNVQPHISISVFFSDYRWLYCLLQPQRKLRFLKGSYNIMIYSLRFYMNKKILILDQFELRTHNQSFSTKTSKTMSLATRKDDEIGVTWVIIWGPAIWTNLRKHLIIEMQCLIQEEW